MSTLNFISGISNCHVPGVYSLVLEERKSNTEGMRRVFFTAHDCKLDRLFQNGDFFVRPHNHRQNIRITRLFGTVVNITLKFGHGEERAYCYAFGSALLNGQFSLEKSHSETFTTHEKVLGKEPLDLHWSVVHTVCATPGSAWLVEEGELAPAADLSRCWSLTPRLELSNEGLYQVLNQHELEWVEILINEGIAKERLAV